MPVLETTERISVDRDRIIPRSLLRHRPIALDAEDQGKGKQDKQEKPDKQDKQDKQTSEPTGIVPVAQRASRMRPKQTEDGQEVEEWKSAGAKDAKDAKDAKEGEKKSGRAATKATPAPITADTADVITKETVTPAGKKLSRLPRAKKQASADKPWYTRPAFYLAVGMVSMLALWALVTMVANWWSVKMDDIQYGRPRTFQTDAVVGHNDSQSNPSHFIAINLNGRIEIIEFPGGDGSKARIYIGPQLYGNGEELVPVTLSFVDINGNHHPDMIVHFQDTQIAFVNENGGFRPATPQELQAIQSYLQRHGG
jgi:hypothetical protein